MWFIFNVMPLCCPFLNLSCIAALLLTCLIVHLGSYVDLVCMVDDWLGLCQACVEKRTKKELTPVGVLCVNWGNRRLCLAYWTSLVDWRSVGVVCRHVLHLRVVQPCVGCWRTLRRVSYRFRCIRLYCRSFLYVCVEMHWTCPGRKIPAYCQSWSSQR